MNPRRNQIIFTLAQKICLLQKKKRVLYSSTVDVLDISMDTPENKDAQEVISISSSSENEFTDVSEKTRFKSKSKFVLIDQPSSRFFVSSTTVKKLYI